MTDQPISQLQPGETEGGIKHNDNTFGGGGLTDGFVLKNYWRILFVKQTIKDAKYFPVNVFCVLTLIIF